MVWVGEGEGKHPVLVGHTGRIVDGHFDVGDVSAYPEKVCGSAAAGGLGVKVVDGSGDPVVNPIVTMSDLNASFSCQTTTGTLGTASQKIRVDSPSNPNWTLDIRAADGAAANWVDTIDSEDRYDFNDPSGSPSGCSDGADADTYAGQMSLNLAGLTFTPKTGCNNTGLSSGSSASFVEGTTDVITLLSATGAGTGCYWDVTGIGLSETVPPQQDVADYSIDFTLTVTAS